MDFLTILIYAGAIQGTFLGCIFWFHDRGNRQANRLLALIITAFTCYLLIPEMTRNYYREWPHLIGITYPIVFILGPLTLLYIKSLIGSELHNEKNLLHFGPAILCLALLVPFFLESGTDKIIFYDSIRQAGLPLIWSSLWGFACVHTSIYSYWAAKKLEFYNEYLKKRFSNIDKINLSWLQKLVYGLSALWGLYLIFFLLSMASISTDPYGVADYIFSLAIVFLVYGIGFMTFRSPEIISYKPSMQNSSYAKSGLDTAKADEYVKEFRDFMDAEKPYKQSDLTLRELADMMDIPPKHLSEILNKQMDSSFYEFVNLYRAREAASMIRSLDDEHVTILEVMYESGFNSKSTFNNYFKRVTGQTPTRYRKKISSQDN